jgi:hypothetical protein
VAPQDQIAEAEMPLPEELPSEEEAGRGGIDTPSPKQ